MPGSADPHDPNERVFLLGIDLEDVRHLLPDGERYPPRVEVNTRRYLEFLSRHGAHTTFFTVGEVARRHPELIAEIAERGHELACHGDLHVPLDRLDRDRFRADVERNVEALLHAGAPADGVKGFRAPIHSLTERVAPWVYEVLAGLGFSYSSSVFPGQAPVYGWPGATPGPSRTAAGVWELPATLLELPGTAFAFAGGVYFRLLPLFALRRLFRAPRGDGSPIVGYLHPYDIDVEQDRFMHPELRDSRLLNALMYLNRGRVLGRLEQLIADGARIIPTRDYVARLACR